MAEAFEMAAQVCDSLGGEIDLKNVDEVKLAANSLADVIRKLKKLTEKPGNRKMTVDGKADLAQSELMQRMIKRGELVRSECKRRGARFLPIQVMRPIYQNAGILEDSAKRNAVLKIHDSDFFIINTAA
ncbi:hypothetical protein R6242_16225 [Iodobacter sp. CM08]|uniref:hypothetical protein n=1 Tax=Iodobacter sp. CM08 TaxID=3085902 RepID=UPI002981DCA4|nr:hypothetical protein [Iodobacter sp. CM08]MDW5418114.1 hypothetical protein [Iodobacter sp. CM08]